MRINSISIENFRRLRNINIPQLDEHVNLFVGINGAGKSSILDAVSLVFSWFTARMLSAKGRGRDIPKDDISIHSLNGCTIKLGLTDNSVWKLYRSQKYHKSDLSDLSDLNQSVSNLRKQLDNGDEIQIHHTMQSTRRTNPCITKISAN